MNVFAVLKEVRMPVTLYTEEEKGVRFLGQRGRGSSAPQRMLRPPKHSSSSLESASEGVPSSWPELRGRIEQRELDATIALMEGSQLRRVGWVRDERSIPGLEYELGSDGMVREVSSKEDTTEYLGACFNTEWWGEGAEGYEFMDGGGDGEKFRLRRRFVGLII